MLAAGQLTERVTIEQPVELRDADYAAVTRTWQTVATVWAAVEPLSGRELIRNREQGADLTVRVRIRYSSAVAGVTPKMRLSYGTRVLEIVEVINVLQANTELQLLCSEFRNG